MKPFHQAKVLSINKEGAIQKAYLKALSHPGEVAWVAEHGGNPNISFGGLSTNHFRKQVIFAAALIEDGKVCRWHYIGFTLSNPTSEYIIVHEAGFKELNSVSLNVKEIGIQDLKDFLIAHSGKFLDRMPLYINHKREDIREIARKVLRGK